MKTEFQQEPSEAAADGDGGSCASAMRSSGLGIAMGIARQ